MRLSRPSVGQALRTARDSAGLTLSALAEVTSLTTSSISRTERGERDLTYSELVEISEVLKIDVEHFRELAEAFERLGAAQKKEQLDTLASDLAKLQKAAIEAVIEARSLGVST